MERLTDISNDQNDRRLSCMGRCYNAGDCINCDSFENAVDRLAAYEDAEEAGLFARIDERFALAMLAGARAIEQNPRKYFGATFVHDVFGDKPKGILYHDAAKMLREEAEAALKEG